MCRGPSSTKDAVGSTQQRLLLVSKESFAGHEKEIPNPLSMTVTGGFVVAFLVMMELTLRQLFWSIKDLHPILENETHRQILARHVGVDAFSCFVVAYLGYQARHIVRDMIDAALGRRTNAMPVAYEQRMFTYRPEAARITLFFFAYQVKNTYDTIVWDDGLLFIMHHVLTLFTAWGALVQGSAHFYVPFYFGVSEVSTAVLCLLANFDDVHGVPGLADAFPVGKAVLGGIFAILFVICRVLMWSTVSYFYCRDAWNALSGSDPRLKGRKTWLRFTFVSLSLLSLLQIIWLAEIGRVGKMEMGKMGLI